MESNFNMMEIGNRIAALRKANKLTQQELADKLHISFQAVSNWERGESMPDIGKLLELSEILGISADGLLGRTASRTERNSKTVHVEITHDKSEEEPDDFKLLMSLVPFLDSSTLDRLVMQNRGKLSLSQLVELAPFLSGETLDNIVLDAKADSRSLIALAPFLSSNTLSKLAEKLFANETDDEPGEDAK
ncbi:MAG: helix-turn-helix transcriptional regulator [Clostridia bacterium]|nr:helix-turn-helix transcriptional regulator [Clostridia bacterium]